MNKIKTEKKVVPFWTYPVTFLIVTPFAGLIFLWYDYLYINYNISYFQAWVLAVGVFFTGLCAPFIKYPLSLLLGISIIIQLLNWVGLVTLPIFK